MRRAISFLFLLTLALGCATARSVRPATIPQPDISARLVQQLHFGGGRTAPATVEVRITNRGQVPIMARRVEIESPGMYQYTLDRGIRDFHETIQPGETKALTIFSRATASTTVTPDEPLLIRAIVELSAGDSVWREVAMTRQ